MAKPLTHEEITFIVITIGLIGCAVFAFGKWLEEHRYRLQVGNNYQSYATRSRVVHDVAEAHRRAEVALRGALANLDTLIPLWENCPICLRKGGKHEMGCEQEAWQRNTQRTLEEVSRLS